MTQQGVLSPDVGSTSRRPQVSVLNVSWTGLRWESYVPCEMRSMFLRGGLVMGQNLTFLNAQYSVSVWINACFLSVREHLQDNQKIQTIGSCGMRSIFLRGQSSRMKRAISPFQSNRMNPLPWCITGYTKNAVGSMKRINERTDEQSGTHTRSEKRNWALSNQVQARR